MVVHDIDRPDVGGVPPKMAAIAELLKAETAGLMGWLRIGCDDNLMSSVFLRASIEVEADWPYHIWHNSHGVILSILPANGRRYYDPADQAVTLELTYRGSGVPKLRKYTGPVGKVIAKIKDYLLKIKADLEPVPDRSL